MNPPVCSPGAEYGSAGRESRWPRSKQKDTRETRKQRTYVTESPPNRPRSSPRPGVRPLFEPVLDSECSDRREPPFGPSTQGRGQSRRQTRENALRRPYTPLAGKRRVRVGFGWPNASQTPLSASAGRLGGLPEDRPGAGSSPARKQRTYVAESATAPRRGTCLPAGRFDLDGAHVSVLLIGCRIPSLTPPRGGGRIGDVREVALGKGTGQLPTSPPSAARSDGGRPMGD